MAENKKNLAYEIITERILKLLEQGTVPWHKPWTGGGLAQNLVSKRPYRGINCFLLNISGYSSPYWATLNQINKKGGRVIKGQKSTPVVFWKWIEIEDQETGDKIEKPFLRYYRVFNLEQTEGVEAPEEDKPKEIEFTPIERCREAHPGDAQQAYGPAQAPGRLVQALPGSDQHAQTRDLRIKRRVLQYLLPRIGPRHRTSQ